MASFGDTIMKGFRNLHVRVYHSSGGKWGGSINGSPLLLLTVVGHKSGKVYTIPLAYVRDGSDYLITASANGADKNPIWLSNLENMPDAKIEVSGKTLTVKPTLITGVERDQLYELFKAQGSNFGAYEKKTTRKIPVIRLQPIAAA
ncbi:MAG: nitroreductase/quinone reductase family protein [Chloroflexota bacterium]